MSGLTFSELRAYEPGDDVRHLDWNVTARQGKPYVRRFIEERALTLWLIVDVSASLRFGPEGRSKADRAAQAAALLATAAIRNGDRVGLAMVSDRVEAEVRPGAGEAPRPDRPGGRHAHGLARDRPDGGLGRLRRSSRRALVVVLSDFLDGTEPLGVWRRVAQAERGIACGWSTRARRRFPTPAWIDVEEAEDGTRRVVDAGSRKVRDAYARAAEDAVGVPALGVRGGRPPGSRSGTAADPIGPLTRIFTEPPRPGGRDRDAAEPRRPRPRSSPAPIPAPNRSTAGAAVGGWAARPVDCGRARRVWAVSAGAAPARGAARPRPSKPPLRGRRRLTPERRSVALADRVRAALVARFGPAWRAKTTEEIAATRTGREAFGSRRPNAWSPCSARPIGSSSRGAAGPRDDRRVGRLVAGGRARRRRAAGARSKINGK